MAAECGSHVPDVKSSITEHQLSVEYQKFSKELTDLPTSCEYIGRIKKVMSRLADLEKGVYTDQLRRQFDDIDTVFAERSRYEEFTSNAEREWIEADFERECRTAQREFDERVHELRDQLIERLESERRALEAEKSTFDLVNDGGEQKTMCTRNLRKRTETTAFATRASRATAFEPEQHAHAHANAATSVTTGAGSFSNALFGTLGAAAAGNTRYNSTLPFLGEFAMAIANSDAKRPRRMSPTQLNFLLNDEEIQDDLRSLRNALTCDSPSRASHSVSQRLLGNTAGRLAGRKSVGRHVGVSPRNIGSSFRVTERYRFNVLPHEATYEDGVLLYDGRPFKCGQPVSVELRGDDHRDSLSRRRFAAFIKTILPAEIVVKRTLGDSNPQRITLHDLANGRVLLTRRS